ncbi:hypothetical protein PVK06_034056 [Gossypium arboreum]|uniref:DUF4283 domain-containing protein n=1 Tax=Gossypium arboreum TaxID=29729 RepID=A0ABR0NDH3_GOSAR|nr:hypothetical protein PVK06_034056 [Gossypium arboreum]
MADLWHPIWGICISDLGERRFLFQFFHEVDIQRVLMGTPWFFNNHLLLLHRLQPSENPSLVQLNFSEFWVQIHDLPPGLMSEPLVKQFGNFLGQFIEYDTSFRSTNFFSFMRIRVHIDVTVPLKPVRRCASSVSRWLRKADGTESFCSDKERNFQGRKSGNLSNFGNNLGNNLGQLYQNSNFIPLGYGHSAQSKGLSKWTDVANQEFNKAGDGTGPMELQAVGEEDPLQTLEGKKRQRMMDNLSHSSGQLPANMINELSASSIGQSSRAQ